MSLITNWQDVFYYDETSPTCLRWAVEIVSGKNGNKVNCHIGDVAGDVDNVGRVHYIVSLNYKQFLVHRVIYEMFNGYLAEGDFVDHIDGNGKNNRKENLRKVSHAVNMRNCKLREDNKTGIVGVGEYISRHGAINFTATWKWLSGKQGSKTFSAKKYGYDEAFRLACDYRQKMIEQLNAQGAGYTESHGIREQEG